MEKFSLKSLLIIVVILLIGIVALFRIQQHGKSVMAGWFSDSWQYRKAITIGYTGASALTDFQVSVDIGTSALIAAGKMKSDCNDIRFTDQTGKLLDYWIEENNPGCNQVTDTKIWIKMPKVTTSGTQLYLYYGNPSATTVQDGNKVFEFFDDFNNGTGKWTREAGVTTSIITESTNKVLALSNTITWYGVFAGSETMSDYIYEARVKTPVTRVGIYARHKSSGNTDNGFYLRAEADNFGFSQNDGALGGYGSSVIDPNTWYKMKIIAVGSSAILYFNDVNQNINNVFQNTTGNIGLTPIEPGTVYFDNIFVRKYAASDPTKTLSSEEKSPAPIAYWSLDEGVGTSVFDGSSNRKNGAIGAGMSWQTEDQCVTGKCLKFDGVNNTGITITNEPIFTPSDNWSVSFWAKIDSSQTTWQHVIGFGNGDGSGWGIMANHGGAPFIYTGNVATGATSTATGFYGNTLTYSNDWKHYTLTKNGHIYTWYINGKQNTTQDKGANDVTLNTSSTWKIGYNWSERYKGFLDEIKVFAYARTAAQIKQDYKSGLSGMKSQKGGGANIGGNSKKSLSDGLVGYWKMDEGVGTSLADSSGIGYTATFGAGDSAPGFTSGKFGIGISFDGTNDYINFGNPGLSSLNHATVSFWRKAINTTQWLLFHGINTGGYLMATHGTDNFYHSAAVVTGSQKIYVDGQIATAPITDSNWHHYVISDVNLTSWTSFRLSYYTNYQYNGLIDEIRLYNRALSKDEVKQLYQFNPNPVAYYDLNEGTGMIANDKSGFGNNATIYGTASTIWSIGKYGKAFTGNGSANYFQTPTLSNVKGISMWVYNSSQNDGGSWHYLLDARNGSGNSWFAAQGIGGDWTKMYVNGISLPVLWSNLPKNQWFHLYIEATNAFTDDINFGSRVSNSEFFYGLIDEVKIYNYAISQKQIISDMNAGHPNVGSPVGSAIAHYKFDEGYGTIANNSGSVGSTINGTFGTGNSAPTWINNGKFNKALSLDGSDYVFLPGSNLENIGAVGDFTITAWNNQSSFSGVEVIVGQGFAGPPGGHTYGRWQIGTNGSKGYISLYGGASSSTYKRLTGLTNLSANTWNHITSIYSRSEGKLKLYINGKYDSQLTWDGYIENIYTNRMAIGYNSGTNDQYMTGLIDEVKIYNYALTDDEIKLDYQHGASTNIGVLSINTGSTASNNASSQAYCVPGDTSTCLPPVAEWNMDEKTGTIIYDTSGSGNTGAITGATWTSGKIGSALKFDGNDYIINGVTQGHTGNLTINSWIKTNSSSIGTIVSKYGNNNYWTYRVYTDANGKVNFERGNNVAVAWRTTLTSNISINDNNWHYISVNYDSTNMKIYIDGKLDNSTPENRTADGTNFYNFCIGNDHWYCTPAGPKGFFNGQIDQVRIYNYARTPAQIAWDYNRGAPIAWWKFDECQGGIAYNSAADPATAGLGSTGTIVIGAGGSQVSLGSCSIGDTSAWSNGNTGKINSAMSFDGTDDCTNMGDPSNGSLDFGLNDFSTSAWFKTNTSAIGLILGKYNGYPLWYSKILANGKIEVRIGFDSSTNFTISTGAVVNDNQWHNIITVYKRNGNLTKYIDGKIDSTPVDISSVSNSTVNTNNAFRIGSPVCTDQFFKGLIDDVRIYNYALTSDQVKSIYSNGGAVNFR